MINFTNNQSQCLAYQIDLWVKQPVDLTLFLLWETISVNSIKLTQWREEKANHLISIVRIQNININKKLHLINSKKTNRTKSNNISKPIKYKINSTNDNNPITVFKRKKVMRNLTIVKN